MRDDFNCICSDQHRKDHSLSLEDLVLSRRDFLLKTGMGMGALSLASILGVNPFSSAEAAESPAISSSSPLLPKTPPLRAQAKAVIHIFAYGGPSHVDTFDPKPLLNKYDGQALPGMNGVAFPSPFTFKKYGKSGIEVSQVFPKLGKCVDEMAIIRSMWTDIPAHEVAQRFMNTGSLQLPKPSLGSWVLYGLGSVNQNMPGFIALGGAPEWRASHFLPGVYQGCEVQFSTKMEPEQVLQNIQSYFAKQNFQRDQLDLAKKLNEMHLNSVGRDSQMEARIESFEMAFKMQTEATDAFDLSKESEVTRMLYGKTEMGAKLLVARRLIERGVRFIQVSAGDWDHHNDIETNISRTAGDVDGPAAALIQDLKQRGLLDSTLVIWGGEFGRTVVSDQNGNRIPGRDHNGRAFCTWLAGGGVKGGTVYGATDEFGSAAVTDKVHVHDLHATILRLLGFDHTKLTYRYNGRDFRLTDNYGKVVEGILT